MSTRGPTGGIALSLALLGGATALGAVALARRDLHPARTAIEPPPRRGIDRRTAVRAARRLNRAAGTLAVSVLADSAVEHYRGSFHNKAMVAPLVTGALSLLASAHGVADRRPGAHVARDAVYALAGLTGMAGTGFHVWNVTRKPGGLCWQNLFYSAPIGAPAALVLSGMLGFLAERTRNNVPGRTPTIAGMPAGRAVAAATGAGPRAHQASVRALVVAAHRADRPGGRRFPRHRRRPQHGWLAQLVAEPAERPAHPGAAEFHRPGPGRACRAGPAGGPPG